MKSCSFLLTVFLSALTLAHGDTSTTPVPPETMSPDGRYGVTVPERVDSTNDVSNFLVEMKTKRIIDYINADLISLSTNHDSLMPAWWSAGDTYLLWQVQGKWAVRTQMLIHLKDGAIDYEFDVLAALQRSILTRTEAAAPAKFIAAKKAHWGNGSAYPETFTIDSLVDGVNKAPLKFPLYFHVSLTSDPKEIDAATALNSALDATLESDGTIKITAFHLNER